MKKIFPLLALLCAVLAFARCAAPKQDLCGYYVLSNPRTESNAMYVGQVKIPSGFSNTESNDYALQACWERSWTLPTQPDAETARYIFRIDRPAASRRAARRQPNDYTIQNLGYARYLQTPELLYRPVCTTTTPCDTFEILPSDLLRSHYTLRGKRSVAKRFYAVREHYGERRSGRHSKTLADTTGYNLIAKGFTVTQMDDSYLHASNDLNTVVRWTADISPSHWRLNPVPEAYALDAFRAFNPKAETSLIDLPQGHICAAPDVSPAQLLDSIISRYQGSWVYLVTSNAALGAHSSESARGLLKTVGELGGKIVFVSDESASVYDWLEFVKACGGDHYRVPTLPESASEVTEQMPYVAHHYVYDALGVCRRHTIQKGNTSGGVFYCASIIETLGKLESELRNTDDDK